MPGQIWYGKDGSVRVDRAKQSQYLEWQGWMPCYRSHQRTRLAGIFQLLFRRLRKSSWDWGSSSRICVSSASSGVVNQSISTLTPWRLSNHRSWWGTIHHWVKELLDALETWLLSAELWTWANCVSSSSTRATRWSTTSRWEAISRISSSRPLRTSSSWLSQLHSLIILAMLWGNSSLITNKFDEKSNTDLRDHHPSRAAFPR